ncbi:MAG: cation transporter [Clostridia bacterium]|nr:cation transporter [Clostridia bacterium]
MRKMISVTGLDCAHCAAEFENIVKNSPGIEDAKINFMLEKLIVTADSEEDIKSALAKACKSFPDAQCK